MRKHRVQSLSARPARENQIPTEESKSAQTWRLGFIHPANDQIEIMPMSDGDDGGSTTSGPPDPPPDPAPNLK